MAVAQVPLSVEREDWSARARIPPAMRHKAGIAGME